MASSSTGTGDDVFELEVMRKEDSSWHPCHVSFSSCGGGLFVHYESNDSEDIIVNSEEAFTRLRIRSVPLQGDDCSHIQPGEHVLATQKSQSKSLSFDAEVEKVLRVRHSKRVHCRCTFMIKWLHQDLKGGILTVPCSSIMKLAANSIDIHPTISAFLDTVKTLSRSNTSPLETIVEDMDLDMDLHDFLEKQINKINSSAYASKKTISGDILFGVEVNTRDQIHHRSVSASKIEKSHGQIQPDQDQFKRSAQSRSKLKVEMEVKELPPPSPPIPEELSESRSPLNPLAARAALASLMSKSPQNLELSIYHEEKQSSYTLGDTHKHVVIESSNENKSHNSPVGNRLTMLDKIFLEPDAASVSFVTDTNKVVKSLISTWSVSGEPQHVDAPSGIPAKEAENENLTSKTSYSTARLTCSADRKLRKPTKGARITRSTIKKGTQILNEDTDLKASAEEIKIQSSSNTRRVTRSALRKENEIQITEAIQGMEENTSANCTVSDSAGQSALVLESSVSADTKLIASPLDDQIELFPAEESDSLAKKEKGNKEVEIKRMTQTDVVKPRKSTNSRNLTHARVNEGKFDKVMEAKEGLEADELTHLIKSNSFEGNATFVDHNVLETKETNSLPHDAEANLPLVKEGSKQERIPCAIKATRRTGGEVSGNGDNGQGLKRKSTTSRKQELRFSPRLKFLPRTRSQNRS